MSVSQVQCRNYELYIGLSTDTKPAGGSIAGAGPSAMDQFFEEDTGRVYAWDGTNWVDYYDNGSAPNKVWSSNAIINFNNQGVGSVTNPTAQSNNYWNGLNLYAAITAVSGTSPSLVLTIYGISHSKYYTLLTGTAITAVGNYNYQIYPGITGVAGQYLNLKLPMSWGIGWAITGTTPSFTGSMYVELLS